MATTGKLMWSPEPEQQAAQQWSYDNPASFLQQNLDPAYASSLVKMWNDAGEAKRTWIDGYGVMGGPQTFYNESGEYTQNTPRQIMRRLNDGSDYYDLWNEDGTYAGRSRDSSSWVTAREGLKDMAKMAALIYGGQYAFGDGGLLAGGGAASGGVSAGTGGANWGAVASSAGKGALTNAGITAVRGGGMDDILRSAAIGGVVGGVGGYGADAGWNPAATKAVQGGTGALLNGGDAKSALVNGAISGVTSFGSNAINTGGGINTTLVDDFKGGGNMDYSQLFDQSLYDFGDTFDQSQVDDPSFWDNITKYISDGNITGDNVLTTTPATNVTPTGGGNNGGGGNKGGNNGGGNMWPLLLGGLLGALDSRNKTTTTTQAPWEPAQPYLKGLLSEGADLYSKYKAQPFSPAQQAGYANMGQILDLVNNNAAGLLGGFQQNASGANQFVRGQPRGLLGSNFQPTADQWRPQNFWDLGVRSKG